MNSREHSPLVAVLQTVLLFASQILDFGTTMIGLKIGGHEANGVIRTIMDQYGTGGFLVFKLGISFLLAVVCWRRPAAALFMTALMCGVALWNLHVIYSLV